MSLTASGPKLGSTHLTVPKREWNQSCEDSFSSGSSGSDVDMSSHPIGFPGLQVRNLKNALERGQVGQSYDHLMRPDIKHLYNQFANEAEHKKKFSFSIDSLAKSDSKTSQPPMNVGANHPNFTTQHQEIYRKALENLNRSQQKMASVPNGLVPLLNMTQGNMNPAMNQAAFQSQFLAHQAHMARLHQQKNMHMKQRQMPMQLQTNQPSGPPMPSRRLSLSASIVREAKHQLKGLDPENMYIECPLCNKRIKRLYHFQRHMRIHSGEKSHQCPYCPYRSVRKDNLKSHLKTHEKHAMEARRNVQLIDKKRKDEILTMRRLQHFSMNHLGNVLNQHNCPTMKEEAIIKEIDSGCESPQEEMLMKRESITSDTSGIESGQSDRHSSKESDSIFTGQSSPNSITHGGMIH